VLPWRYAAKMDIASYINISRPQKTSAQNPKNRLPPGSTPLMYPCGRTEKFRRVWSWTYLMHSSI